MSVTSGASTCKVVLYNLSHQMCVCYRSWDKEEDLFNTGL